MERVQLGLVCSVYYSELWPSYLNEDDDTYGKRELPLCFCGIHTTEQSLLFRMFLLAGILMSDALSSLMFNGEFITF